MSRIFSTYLIWLTLLTALVSCDPARLYEKNSDIQEEDWKPGDTLSFEFNIPYSKEKYNLYYSIRYSQDYPYYNLFTKYYLLDSSGSVIRSPKLPEDMYLFDVKTGKPYGSGIGSVYDLQVSFLKNYSFPYSGKYTLKVIQYMRNRPINGISSFGLRVEKASQNPE